jgi:uncharacterized protein (TIGR02265 family)
MAEGRIKGGVLQSRLAFVRDLSGDSGAKLVVSRMSEEDQRALAHLATGLWYPFGLGERLDQAIAAETGMGDEVFRLMGEKSAAHNLGSVHRIFVEGKDPHGLLRRAAQIYQAYYDTGSRSYEKLAETKAVLRTTESATYSHADCLTVVGWHRKAIEMCGGANVRVTETSCRTRGAETCEYLCEWT